MAESANSIVYGFYAQTAKWTARKNRPLSNLYVLVKSLVKPPLPISPHNRVPRQTAQRAQTYADTIIVTEVHSW